MVDENHAISKELPTQGGSLSFRGDDVVISEDEFEVRASLNSESVNSIKFNVKNNSKMEDIGFYIELDGGGVEAFSAFLNLMERRMKEIDNYDEEPSLLVKATANRGP